MDIPTFAAACIAAITTGALAAKEIRAAFRAPTDARATQLPAPPTCAPCSREQVLETLRDEMDQIQRALTKLRVSVASELARLDERTNPRGVSGVHNEGRESE